MYATFISYSHEDKAIARRVARRLDAHGIKVWMDERELRIGDELDETIKDQIRDSKTLVVIATQSAAASRWVEKELSFAASVVPPVPILPVFIEEVHKHPLFSDRLGVEASDRLQFERSVLKLGGVLADGDLPPPSPERLQESLSTLEEEQPILSSLLDDMRNVNPPGLCFDHAESIARLPFHDLDFAINALYDQAPDFQRRKGVAWSASSLFPRTGVGSYVLERHLEMRTKGDIILANAVGRGLDPAYLDTALHLLRLCDPPDDHALARFIDENAKALTLEQQTQVVSLVTHPRRGPTGLGADAAFAALRHFHEREDLRHVWGRWIRDGLFDGLSEGSDHPSTLAYYLCEAQTRNLKGWESIIHDFVWHVRWLARQKSREAVLSALQHLMEAADLHSPLLEDICDQCRAAPGSAEWKGWQYEREMTSYVQHVVAAASTDRDWSRAFSEAAESLEKRRKLDELLHGAVQGGPIDSSHDDKG